MLPTLHAYRLTQITYRVVDEFKRRKIDEMRRIQSAVKGGRDAPARKWAADAAVTQDDQPRDRPAVRDPRRGARDEEIELTVNPADDRRLRVKIPKRSARDFLEADEVLSLLVAGEVFDNPVRPDDGAGGRGGTPVRDHDT